MDNSIAEPTGTTWRRHRLILTAGLACLAVLVWILFHPELQPDKDAVTPSVRAELAKAGFRVSSGVTAATFQTVRNFEGAPRILDVRQKITVVDELLTEKRTRRYAKFYFEESIGFYVGPITVVRHTRSALPMVAYLLPRQFWTSSHMSAFTVQHVDESFPNDMGSKLIARITYEDRYTDGELAQTERIQLRCDIREVIDAASVDVRLPGLAARIECEEHPDSEPVARNPQSNVVFEGARYAQLYIFDLGWSIPLEGERTWRLDDLNAKETWKSELKSFERRAAGSK